VADDEHLVLLAEGNVLVGWSEIVAVHTDVFLVNGTSLDGKGPGEKSTSHLYRNLGKLRLEDVTAKSGLGRTGWGQGACVGDYDNDGRDLCVTYYGHSVLYPIEGGGVIRDGARVSRGWIGSGMVIYRHSANRRR